MSAASVVGRNIKRFREDRGYSIRELARQSGLSKQTISKIESAQGNPTVDTLEEIAKTLGVGLRALLSELGTEVLYQPHGTSRWHDRNGMSVRTLDQVFGSGYVTNAVIRLEANRGPSRHRPSSHGSLWHCFVQEGRVRLGPDNALVTARAGDFIRFPGDGAYSFEAITPVAQLVVCATLPQLTMAGGDRLL